jgi:hypothetical protein
MGRADLQIGELRPSAVTARVWMVLLGNDDTNGGPESSEAGKVFCLLERRQLQFYNVFAFAVVLQSHYAATRKKYLYNLEPRLRR